MTDDTHLLTEIPLKRGALVISIDLELAWGVWDKVTPEDVKLAVALERDICQAILDLFDRYAVPATWAVVGRLLVEPGGDDRLPGDTRAWYAPEIVEAIRSRPTSHEIGSHSYAHRYFGTDSLVALRRDLEQARSVHERWGLEFISFVFPRNQVAHLGLLEEVGLRVFRSRDQGLLGATEHLPSKLRMAINLGEKILPIPPPAVRSSRRSTSVIELPSSTLLLGRKGIRRMVSSRTTRWRHMRGLERASEKRDIFHLWFHPSNFYFEPDKQLEVLENTLRHARKLADRGQLDIRTMSSFIN